MDILVGLVGRWVHRGTGAHVLLEQGMLALAPQLRQVRLVFEMTLGVISSQPTQVGRWPSRPHSLKSSVAHSKLCTTHPFLFCCFLGDIGDLAHNTYGFHHSATLCPYPCYQSLFRTL